MVMVENATKVPVNLKEHRSLSWYSVWISVRILYILYGSICVLICFGGNEKTLKTLVVIILAGCVLSLLSMHARAYTSRFARFLLLLWQEWVYNKTICKGEAEFPEAL